MLVSGGGPGTCRSRGLLPSNWNSTKKNYRDESHATRAEERALHVNCIVADERALSRRRRILIPNQRVEYGLGLRAIESLGNQNFLDRGISQYCRKGRIGLDRRKFLISLVLGFAQIDHATLHVSRFRKRLGKQEIESAAVTNGAILQNRTAPRAVVLEKLRVQCQRLAEGGNSFLIFFVAEIGISKIAMKDSHVPANIDRFLISLDGLAEFLALVPNRSDVVLRIGVGRIDLRCPFVILESRAQRCLLVQGYPQLVQIDRILRILIGKLFVGERGLAILLTRHIEVGKLLVRQIRLHDDDC